MPQVNPVRLHAAAPNIQHAHKTSWRDQALCMEVDPELFFPDRSGKYRMSVDGERETLAKSMCNRCPVKAECLAYAVDDPSIEGIWGGSTARERLDLRKSRA